MHVFSSVLDRRIHYALTLGKITRRSTTLVRVQSANVLTDALGLSTKGRTGSGINEALQAIAQNKSGALIYLEPLRKEAEEIVASDLNPGKMDFRDYGIGAQVLAALGIKKLQLLTRDRRRVVGLEGYGLEIVERTLLS